ncbi:hypothetical protein [Planococcus sp. ISL-110]|nr:hypothetical protein [Planococcus sp. ISL-110]MBT2570132.1 hypothetical protein [Planococcus sp. ISL-110]
MKIQIIGGFGTGKNTLAPFMSAQENGLLIDTDRCIRKEEVSVFLRKINR